MSADNKNKVLAKNDELVNLLNQPITNFSSLSAQIEAICGKPSIIAAKAAFEPLGSTLWKDLERTKDLWKGLTAVTMPIPKIQDSALRITGTPIDSIGEVTSALSGLSDSLGVSISALSKLEAQTSIIARDFGIPKITSVATQISSIAGLVSPLSESVRELIAPTTMLTDLSKIALDAHHTILGDGRESEWKLGLVDSASYLVDRQVDWTSQICHTVYGDTPFISIDSLAAVSPRGNIISWLPKEFEEEKKRKKDIKPKEALDNSAILRLSEKGKKLINRVVDINNLCSRTGREPLFKYTGTTTRAAATMGGTACVNRDDFGDVVDGLYMFFYENLERIKGLVSEAAVRGEDVFQCIFRIKALRTDYRHDYEHGSDGDIRKANKKIGDSYKYYTGKPVLTSRQDYLQAQEKLYDEFDVLADYLENELVKKVD